MFTRIRAQWDYTYRRRVILNVFLVTVFLYGEVFSGHPQTNSGQGVRNFDVFFGEHYNSWIKEIHEIGAVSEDLYEVRFAILHVYKMTDTARIPLVTALRVDALKRHGVEGSGRGWLLPGEVAQLTSALPGKLRRQPVAVENLVNPYVEVAFPRGGVAFGFEIAPDTTGQQRYFGRVGVGHPITAFLRPERFTDLAKLISAGNKKIQDLQDKSGQRR